MVAVQFLGGGRMADALIGGILAAGRPVADLAVVEITPARRDELTAAHPGLTVLAEPGPAEAVVVATKPGDVVGALRAAADAAPELRRVLSIAAGVDTATLESAVPAGVAVVRAMPNTPALVGAGAAAICAGSSATDDDLAWAESLLGAVGTVERVPERLMDAVTGLSGSGPAYVFLVAEALTDAGVLAGLPRDVADRLTRQTLLGAARLLASSDEGPEALRAAVTSPGGTTAAGLRELESHAVRAAVIDAVAAAAARSAELG
jgi:pyrroline-5-carboxylate reductase